nr:hypothetical protein [Tanacetum cinerariifolium]
IISQTVRDLSSRVPTPLPDDPYVAVRHAHLVDTNTESGPLEDLRETGIPQPLLVTAEPKEAPLEIKESLTLVSRAPLTDEEFEASKPLDTRTTSLRSSASSDSTAPLSPDHPLTQVSPTPIPTRVLFHHRTVRMTMRAQPIMYPGLSARVTEAMTLSYSDFHKRGTIELILDTETEDDESEIEGAGSGTADEPLGLGYEALRRRELALGHGLVPST